MGQNTESSLCCRYDHLTCWKEGKEQKKMMRIYYPSMVGPSKVLTVAGFYFFCSISMNFLNKAVVSSYEFNYPFFIMACQMVVTVLCLDFLRVVKIIKLPAYSMKEGLEFLPCSLAFSLHSTLSLIALHGMNIPM